jgi:serine/threonine protein kinase
MLENRARQPAAAAAVEATVTDVACSPALPCAGPIGLEAGEMLAGRYRVRRFIAAGGMGEVYEVDDLLLGEQVALKLLRPELLRKPGAQARFAEEIKLARRVTHPNVCRVHDVGADGERVFFTMALHTGDTLAGLLAQKGRFDEASARPIVGELLAGIVAAHTADIVHADLKPSNVLLTGRPGANVMITDFGLAVPCCAEFGCRCDMPHVIGTPAYMAPEQIVGGTALERTDVFAVGVILFEMVTGVLPFRGDTPLAMAMARLDQPAPAPRSLVPGLDPAWDAIILRCLAREPSERPGTAEVAQALGLR